MVVCIHSFARGNIDSGAHCAYCYAEGAIASIIVTLSQSTQFLVAARRRCGMVKHRLDYAESPELKQTASKHAIQPILKPKSVLLRLVTMLILK